VFSCFAGCETLTHMKEGVFFFLYFDHYDTLIKCLGSEDFGLMTGLL
jgi:hypothetical protein